MTADQLRDCTTRLDDFDVRLAVIEAAHADLMRLLDGVPSRCRAPGCAHLTAGALCPAHAGVS